MGLVGSGAAVRKETNGYQPVEAENRRRHVAAAAANHIHVRFLLH